MKGFVIVTVAVSVVLLSVASAEELTASREINSTTVTESDNDGGIEEGRIRHHHFLPLYGGLCKKIII